MADFIKSLLFKNWQYKLGALITAIALWFYVVSGQNLTVVLNLPIELDNFPASMKIVNKVANSVDLTVTGRRDIVNDINKKEMSVRLNLKNAHEGKNTYSINAGVLKSFPRGLEIRLMYPYQIDVELQSLNADNNKQGGK